MLVSMFPINYSEMAKTNQTPKTHIISGARILHKMKHFFKEKWFWRVQIRCHTTLTWESESERERESEVFEG